MKRFILSLLAACAPALLFGQLGPKFVEEPIGLGKVIGPPIKGAPYSATIVTESIQTLADGNRIVQRGTGSTARDTDGRIRHDAILPVIGTMSAANAPHIVFIQDPIAHVSYILNTNEKTVRKLKNENKENENALSAQEKEKREAAREKLRQGPTKEKAEMKTENLGTKTIEGINAEGVRTTRTIPAGEIGNEQPIEIVYEVWTSPELQVLVSSKRSDPRTGEQTYRLTDIQRSNPDPSLFTVPTDFKVLDNKEPGGDTIFYRPNQ